MKLDFHYFTMKFIAARVGYNEKEAQLIASTCQFINDNYQRSALYVSKDQVSTAIIERGLYEDDPAKGPNMCKVPLLLSALEADSIEEALQSTDNQTNILIPFYYFPSQPSDGEDYEVTPIDSLESNASFKKLFQQAKEHYTSSLNEAANEASQALRRLGVLLHIASDSFAYVPFNGYMNKDVNGWTIVEVKDSRNYDVITKQYDPDKFAAYPPVGKYRTSSVCDDYNRQFIIKTSDYRHRSYIRINNDYFEKAAKAVYYFLSYFRGLTPSEQDFRDNVKPTLLNCWNTDSNTFDELKQHWEKLTNLKFDYDEDAARQSIVDYDPSLKPDQQDYFDFLLMLQDVIDAANSKTKEDDPVLTGEAKPSTDVTCDISDPYFNGDTYDLSLNARFPSKVSIVVATLKIIDIESDELIKSATYNYRNIKLIDEKLTLQIPKNNQSLDAVVELSWIETAPFKGQKSTVFQKQYTVIGNSAIHSKLTVYEPRSKSEEKVIKLVNGSESSSADYNYPLNAMYISQEGVAQLDLYTPIDMEIQLADGFTMLDYDNLTISLSSSNGQSFNYCNNSKFITMKVDEQTGLIHLTAREEWKNRIRVEDFGSSVAKLKLRVSATLDVSSVDEDGYRTIAIDNLLSNELAFMWNQ